MSELHPLEKNSFDREDLLKASRGTLGTHAFPRLPAPDMLMCDRITHVSKTGGHYNKGELVAELDINPDLWFFKCHFKDDPVMPGCLGLDACWQLSGFYLFWLGHEGKGRALGVNEVKFTGQVLPTAKKVTYRISVRRVMAAKLTMCIADAITLVDDREIYHAKGLRVGLFSDVNSF